MAMLGSLEDNGYSAGLWFDAMGSTGRLRDDGYASAETNSFGGQAGIDKKINDNVILGASVAFSDAKADFDRYGGNSESENVTVSLYGRYGKRDDSLYIMGRVGGSYISSDVDREIVIGQRTESSSVNHSDYMLSGYGEAGYKFKIMDKVSVTPYAGLAYDYLRRGSFSEDDSLFGLEADSKGYDQFSGLVGIRGELELEWFGGKSNLNTYVSWQKAFNDEDLSFEASYVGLSEEKFEVKGIGLSDDAMWFGVGVTTEVNDRWSWNANYDMQVEDSEIANNVFSLGVRMNLD